MKKLFTLLMLAGILTLSFGAQAQDASDSTDMAADSTMMESADSTMMEEEEVAEPVYEEVAAEPEAEASFHQIVKEQFIDGDARFMGIVLLCLILGLAIAIERIITLNLATTNVKKLLAKVEEALKEVAKSRDGKTISVRLDPPSLGKVQIDVSMREGSLHARLVAESPAVNQMLREKGVELQMLLRKLGFNVDQVTVSFGSDRNNAGEQSEAGSKDGNANGREFTGDADEESVLENAVAAEALATQQVADDHWIA